MRCWSAPYKLGRGYSTSKRQGLVVAVNSARRCHRCVGCHVEKAQSSIKLGQTWKRCNGRLDSHSTVQPVKGWRRRKTKTRASSYSPPIRAVPFTASRRYDRYKAARCRHQLPGHPAARHHQHETQRRGFASCFFTRQQEGSRHHPGTEVGGRKKPVCTLLPSWTRRGTAVSVDTASPVGNAENPPLCGNADPPRSTFP